MGQRYAQLSLEDRCEIARLQAAGRSLRQIAAALDRAPSTISRELKRNGGRQVGYKPAYAEEQAKARRWTGSRLDREPRPAPRVLDRLAKAGPPSRSPAGSPARPAQAVISHESIYRFIYAQIARTKDYSLAALSAARQGKRGCRGRRRQLRRLHRAPCSDRRTAPEAADRTAPGHWEADLMLFAKYGQAILALHERYSRILLAARPPNKAASQSPSISPASSPSCPRASPDRHLRQRHRVRPSLRTPRPRHRHLLLRPLCALAEGRHRERHRPHAPLNPPQDRSRNSPPNGFALVAYNNTPRKCLDCKTPAEVFLSQLLHFECESTSPLSRE